MILGDEGSFVLAGFAFCADRFRTSPHERRWGCATPKPSWCGARHPCAAPSRSSRTARDAVGPRRHPHRISPVKGKRLVVLRSGSPRAHAAPASRPARNIDKIERKPFKHHCLDDTSSQKSPTIEEQRCRERDKRGRILFFLHIYEHFCAV